MPTPRRGASGCYRLKPLGICFAARAAAVLLLFLKSSQTTQTLVIARGVKLGCALLHQKSPVKEPMILKRDLKMRGCASLLIMILLVHTRAVVNIIYRGLYKGT